MQLTSTTAEPGDHGVRGLARGAALPQLGRRGGRGRGQQQRPPYPDAAGNGQQGDGAQEAGAMLINGGRQQSGRQVHEESGVRKTGSTAQYRSPRSLPQRGFSLIEIMVVVVIMGVLAALIVPNVMDRPDQARVIAARQDVASIMQALKLYRLDHGRYPTSEQGLSALIGGKNGQTAYMDRMPVDPWGSPYQYLNPGVHGEIDVFSLGADSQPGGEGNDAEVGSWGR